MLFMPIANDSGDETLLIDTGTSRHSIDIYSNRSDGLWLGLWCYDSDGEATEYDLTGSVPMSREELVGIVRGIALDLAAGATLVRFEQDPFSKKISAHVHYRDYRPGG